ncbi:hypothetical protein N658DRAFT_94864 [Parathielavia hyrcaniae]|uniref:Uncharacterized protein n=1 Tax=Parathielavia hyrcaniae TaxID=113614 RepID=A0AAN6PQE1_9PEZI|nr:hypothetical protein N658DRAFT_94864 [Parathielavia hyrcaniae]
MLAAVDQLAKGTTAVMHQQTPESQKNTCAVWRITCCTRCTGFVWSECGGGWSRSRRNAARWWWCGGGQQENPALWCMRHAWP